MTLFIFPSGEMHFREAFRFQHVSRNVVNEIVAKAKKRSRGARSRRSRTHSIGASVSIPAPAVSWAVSSITSPAVSTHHQGKGPAGVMAARKFGFAVLGLGNMGGVHLKNLMMSARASVQWLVRSQVQEAERFVQSHGLPARCAAPADLDLVLDDASVDAVVICSPTDVHEDQIKRSLLAGKAVFCEKPITSDTEGTRACYDLADSQKQPLFCAFHRRFDPSFQQVKAGVANRTLGSPRLIRCSSHDQDYPPISYIRSSGGIIKDSTIHDIDMALWLSGSKPKRVLCQGQAFHPEVGQCGDFDLVVATVLFENGVVAVIDNGRKSSQAYDQRLEVICDKGGYLVSNRPSQLTSSVMSDATCVAPSESGFVTRYVEAYHAEIEHFLDVLEGRAHLGVSVQDTLAAMSLADAVTEAGRTQQPVDL